MKNSLTHTSKTRGKKELNLYSYRAANVRLTWCKQVISLIKKFKIKSINDLGCNYFQFYKEIKHQKLNYSYFGYDIDKEFTSIGVKHFPSIKKKYKIGNIENIKLRKADCSIISGTLAHSDYPLRILKNIFKSTNKLIIIRDMFGKKHIEKISRYKALQPVNYRQFSFENISRLMNKNNFTTFFILDEATDYSTKSKSKKYAFNRKYYIMVGLKNGR